MRGDMGLGVRGCSVYETERGFREEGDRRTEYGLVMGRERKGKFFTMLAYA